MDNTPLPIDPILPELLRTIAVCPNTVLQAPPGAGKTTRVPLALLDLSGIAAGRIVMLEPRRLAAFNAANRMALALGEDSGETVGYTMRFERRVSARTRIEVVTEGILTRRLQRDPGLEGVSLVIFDEFHERSLNADFALALCLEVQRELRPDLKILVMSATLDCGPVAALLGNAPVVIAEGRSFPVEVRFLEDSSHHPLPVRMAAAVRRALRESAGDVLAFLPGAGEIRACAGQLQEAAGNLSPAIHPLYADLPFAEQQAAILPGPRRKVVLATNIAETSLTIEGIRAVVDSGLTRVLRHDPASGMNRLLTVRESRASAEQRAGRAGRLAPGVCYRLFGPHTFQAMTAFTPPEILVADLSALALELAVWGVRDPASLSWLDPPPEVALVAARELLFCLGALDRDGRTTESGRKMAELPVHPRVARLLLRGQEAEALEMAAILGALLAERDIFRYGPGEVAAICESDLLERYEVVVARNRRADPRVQTSAIRAVERSAAQLARHLGAGEIHGALSDGDAAARLLLAAYPDRVARQREEGSDRYLLANGRGARLSRKSGVRNRPYILAIQVDAGEKGEGLIHQACSLTPELVRSECREQIASERRVVWDAGQERLMAWEEELLGAIHLSRRQVVPSDEEAIPLLLAVIEDTRMAYLNWDREANRLRGRLRLVRQAFPEEQWPNLTDESLLATLADWLAPFLYGVRSRRDIFGLDLCAALRALLTREQLRLLEERAPTHITVPSGSRIEIDYVSGEEPFLAVKLQEMFGCADTPTIAAGRVKLLLHLLSPARRPVQVTRDLKGFWASGYREVKKELKGRYPKHPWPDDPWNAMPTAKTNRALRGKPY
ncbi:MAG: ATP-dependent helicase HrpB [Deltaproteobacteria bacterium]|nr:ATP-dependent helicase HrpB [Deltaproteobacteria bacterium]TLN01278.1 MAG: ATP-dependent helicase HrpB [bacterium]